MGILQNIFNTLSAAFRSLSPCSDEPPTHVLKRPRPAETGLVTDESPPKRRRFDDTISRRPVLTDITQMNNAEADDEVVIVDNTVSPSKFKNAYKAPKHVRSTNRAKMTSLVDLTVDEPDTTHRRRCLGQPAEDMSRDEYCRLLGSMISDKGKRRMQRKTPKKTTTIDLTVDDFVDLTVGEDKNRTRYDKVDLTSLVGPSSRSRSSSLAAIPVRPSATYRADRPFNRFGVSIYQSDNLFQKANYFSEMPSFRADMFYQPDTPISLLDKVKCLSDRSLFNEEDFKSVVSRPFQRVNSFQEKIDKFKWSKEDYLPKFRDTAAKLSENTRRIGQQLEAEAKCASTVAEETVAELIERQLKSHLKITEALLDDEVVEAETVLPTLDDEMIAKIRYAQNRSMNPNEILISKFRLDIRRCDLLTLSGLSWLNDNVINFYMEMIVERSQNNSKYPKVYAFNTFFYSTLSANGYQRVRRFTKKVDIFEKDIILVPVHLSFHWCMAKIDMLKKQVVYYDSMHSTNKDALDTLLDYVASEHKDKKNEILDMSGWTAHCDKTVPQQQNGSDCGVFACSFAEYSSRNAKFSFSQENMPYMRSRMVYEICTGQLLIK